MGLRRAAQRGWAYRRDLERIWQMRAVNSNATADPVGIARWIRPYTSRNKWKHLRELRTTDETRTARPTRDAIQAPRKASSNPVISAGIGDENSSTSPVTGCSNPKVAACKA